MQELIRKADVLNEALPFIQEFKNSIAVVKFGGSAMENPELTRKTMRDIVLLEAIGMKMVVVHGGGKAISARLRELGVQTQFINGLRYTDAETAEVALMVLAGKTNKHLVDRIERTGGRAIGLCGLDGGLLKAKRHTDASGNDYGFVGDVESVDASVIEDVIAKGYIPVISTIAHASDGSGVYNINADTAAAEIAVALKARNFILLTDTRGVLRDPHDESSLIPVIHTHEVAALKESGVVTGGMIPKVDCCVSAAERGIHRTFITDGRIRHSILIEMLSEEGCGTMFTK